MNESIKVTKTDLSIRKQGANICIEEARYLVDSYHQIQKRL